MIALAILQQSRFVKRDYVSFDVIVLRHREYGCLCLLRPVAPYRTVTRAIHRPDDGEPSLSERQPWRRLELNSAFSITFTKCVIWATSLRLWHAAEEVAW